MADENELESIFVLDDMEDYEKGASNTQRTVLTCPDCGGLIWELQEGQLLRFRCHVGHAYSSESMLAKQGEALETALWTAVRTLEERASLLRRLATHAQQGGSEMVVARYNNRAAEVERQADVIRKVLADGKGLSFEQVLLPQVGQEENNPGRQAGEVDMGGSRGRPD